MPNGSAAPESAWGPNAQLAWRTAALEPTRGIPCKAMNVMDHGLLEELAGAEPGTYAREPERVYRDFQLAAGACSCD